MAHESVLTEDLEEVYFFLLFGFAILLIAGGVFGVIVHSCCFQRKTLLIVYLLVCILLLLCFASLIFVGVDVKNDFSSDTADYCSEHDNCSEAVTHLYNHLCSVDHCQDVTVDDIVEIYTDATTGFANLAVACCSLVVVMLLVFMIITCFVCREV